jgi:Ca2+-binding RTX toxin-like protein
MFSHTLKRIFASTSFARPGASSAGGVFVCACIEPMEVRRMYAVTAALDPGTHVLTITGDGSHTITIYRVPLSNGDEIDINVSNQSPDLGSFLASNVNKIRFNGSGGAETVKAESAWDGSVGTGHVAVNKPLDFYGSYGNDVFTGGDAADLLDGGPDNDIIHGAKGSDTMYGGSGDDVFYVETNDAPMYMYGGDGQDQFHTSNGVADYIDGGAGSDTATDRDTSNPADTVVNVETL